MKVSESQLRRMQAQGAIVQREPKPVPQPAHVPADPKDASLDTMANAAVSQAGLLSEIAAQLREANEFRNSRVRLSVNRDQKGLIKTIDIERL